MHDDTRTLLIVDDEPTNLEVLDDLLSPHYRVRAVTSGAHALQAVHRAPRPDLILLDILMPVMDGFEVLRRLSADAGTRDIPVIFVTAVDSAEGQLRGLRAGAVDYITKPLHAELVLARVRTQLELKQARDRLADQNAWLETEVQRRMSENDITQQVTIRALAHLAETRDPETGNHIQRTQSYVSILAHALMTHPRFKSALNDHVIDLLVRSAPLHDIGKVGIPDHILLKPGPLTDAERALMSTHAKLGADAIRLAEHDVDHPVEFMTLAKEIAHWHHEKWDGSGYPDGLAGDGIPVSARLMALADVFDALISERVYKPAFSFEQACEIITKAKGRHFDPDVVDAFLSHCDEFRAVAAEHPDTPGAVVH
ncbi:MAG: response regulator [Gammaproteobacteria bacterium]